MGLLPATLSAGEFCWSEKQTHFLNSIKTTMQIAIKVAKTNMARPKELSARNKVSQTLAAKNARTKATETFTIADLSLTAASK